jgi:hypothetical protein
MSMELELYNSRVDHIVWEEDAIVLHFSVAYIYKARGLPGAAPGSEWSQEAKVILNNATVSSPLPPLPNTIADGFLEIRKIRYEMVPVPYSSTKSGRLYLRFVDNSEVEIIGEKPHIDLIGSPIFLEEIT